MRKLSLFFLAMAFLMVLFAILPSVLAATTNGTSTTATSTTAAASSAEDKFLGAGIAFGLAALGAAYGVGQSGAAAIAAVTEKAEVRTTALIFVVLAEAIAIYGFAIAILILSSSG
jgi:V/A-type H+-transporting ATPase subunit K